MKEKILTIEDAKKIANYDKLEAKLTMIESDLQLYKNLIKVKDETIKTLRKQLKEQITKYNSVVSIEEQIKMELDI